jgi:hypothetical protein
MSFSPKNFFAYFSAAGQACVIVSTNGHTESPLVDLFSRKGKHRDQFDHYLDHHLSHCGGGRNLRINPKSSEKVLNAFKDFG